MLGLTNHGHLMDNVIRKTPSFPYHTYVRSTASHSASDEETEFSNIFILRDPQLPMETPIQQDRIYMSDLKTLSQEGGTRRFVQTIERQFTQ